jgi:hypothetical protein
MRKSLLSLIASAALVLPATSNALTISLDNPSPFVLIPLSGTYSVVDFFGTLTLDPDDTDVSSGPKDPFVCRGLEPCLPVTWASSVDDPGYALRFSVRVDSFVDVGTYGRNTEDGRTRLEFRFRNPALPDSPLPSATAFWWVNVVDRAPVSEPNTVAILGLGLLTAAVTGAFRRTRKPA